jgi:hypothetical protein
MRKYIWDYDVVEALADLEVASYRIFPDVREVHEALSRLKYLVSYYDVDDEELAAALDAFEELNPKQDELYANIISFQEVLTNEDH